MASLGVLHERTWGVDVVEFEEWTRRVQPRLMRFAETQLEFVAAQDAVSDTLLTVWVKDLTYPATQDEERALRAFAYKILVGLINNERRRQERSESLVARLGRMRVMPDVVPDSQEDVAARSAHEWIIGKLSPDDGQVLALFVAGFGVAETAEILECSASTVYKRRSRAMARVQTIVERQGGRG